MSQASAERRRFPVRSRWLHADGDLSRPDSPRSRRPAPVDTLQASAETPFSLSRPPLRLALQIATPQCRAHHQLGANIKFP